MQETWVQSWSGKIPHAMTQLNRCATNTESTHHSYWSPSALCSTTREATEMRSRSTENRKKPAFSNEDAAQPKYIHTYVCFCSVIKSDPTLQPHGLQHAILPCPSLSPIVCSNSCPLSQWYFLIISSSAVPSPLPSIFPRIKVSSNESVLPIRWQSTGASDLAIVLPMGTQSWFPLGLTGLNSLQSKGLSRVFFNTTVQKHQFFSAQPSLWFNSHPHITTAKTIALYRFLSEKWYLCFLICSLILS